MTLLSDLITDLYSSFTIPKVYAEAPPAEEQPAEEEAEQKQEPEEEEEEEEEEEPEDPFPALQEECANTKECAPAKHHYDECAERVMAAEADENHRGPKEDCVEEFFHLAHCATQCAAPKLWAKLK